MPMSCNFRKFVSCRCFDSFNADRSDCTSSASALSVASASRAACARCCPSARLQASCKAHKICDVSVMLTSCETSLEPQPCWSTPPSVDRSTCLPSAVQASCLMGQLCGPSGMSFVLPWLLSDRSEMELISYCRSYVFFYIV